MASSEIRGHKAENWFPVSETQLGDSRIDPRRELNLMRCLDTLLRNPIALWMSLAAMLGWILSRLPVSATPPRRTTFSPTAKGSYPRKRRPGLRSSWTLGAADWRHP